MDNSVFLKFFQYQLETIPIPKTVSAERMRQYIDIFDFQLTPNEIAKIDVFYKDERLIKLERAMGGSFPVGDWRQKAAKTSFMQKNR